MHTIHHTQAFVLRQVESGERNKRVWLFTRELGLVVASVQGVRTAQSKLRAQLTDYTLVAADLVRGRDVWRLTSVTLIENPLAQSVRSPHVRAYVRILGAVYRFLADEGDPHGPLFDHLLECCAMTSKSLGDAKDLDTLGIWRVLAHLGYIAVPSDKEWLITARLLDATTKLDAATTKLLIKDASAAITHTHL